MVSQDVVESNVLDNMGVGEDELDVLRTIQCGTVPEVEQGLLVLVDRNARL